MSMIKDKGSGVRFENPVQLVLRKKQRIDPSGRYNIAAEYVHQKGNKAKIKVAAKVTILSSHIVGNVI